MKAAASVSRVGSVLCPVLAAALLLSGCAVGMLKGAAGAGSTGNGSSRQDGRSAARISADDSITSAVRSKLRANPALKAFNLGVATYDGVVTLRGGVNNVGQRTAAERDARSVRGVRAVQNQLTVR